MKSYTLHPDLPQTSRIVYGCMGLGGGWEGGELSRETQREAFAALDTAMEAGITCFDHADIYKRGNAERVFGEYLKAYPDLRDRMVIQSKCGIRFQGEPEASHPQRYDFSEDYIVFSVEGILKRLGIEQLDVLLLHRPDCLMEPEEIAKAFDVLSQSGKVRAFGVSNHSVGQMELLRQTVRQPLVANQLQFSLMHHGLVSDGVLCNNLAATSTLANGVLDYCRLHDIRVQAWSPLGRATMFQPEDRANEAETRVRAMLKELGKKHACPPEAVAIAWILRHPAGIQPVIGSRTPARILAACEAARVRLSREEWYSLLQAARGKSVP